MKTGFSIALGFIGGVCIGAATGYFYAKRKCEARIDEEVESVRQAYKEKYEKPVEKSEEEQKELAKKDQKKPNIVTYYHDMIKDKGYSEEVKDDNVKATKRVVSPEEFGANGDYEQVSLVYTEDGFLLDEDEEPIEEPETLLGMDAKEVSTHFGEYEDDSVFIKNDDAEVYYEILMSNKRYEEIAESLGE